MDVDASAGPSSFSEYQAKLQNAVLQPTKLALGLPKDLAFHRTLDRNFAEDIDECSSRVLALTNKLIKFASTARNAPDEALGGEEDAVDNFHSLVVDVMDRLLEQADTHIDRHLGRNKAAASSVVVNEPKASSSKRITASGPLDKRVLHDPTIQKPQLSFSTRVDNFSASWRPALREKPHAKRALEESMDVDDELPCHPYRFEISQITYPERMFEVPQPSEIATFDATPFTLVTTPEEFARMLAQLRKAHEIAVDLEHHSYRTYSGFLCLMQISTREEDWVVDLLAVREQVPALGEVFANPEVVKVFHGAESDIVWLQQDFSLYIVNLFDTYHATKVLDFPKHSLASLLDAYTDFTPDKRYQLADWRIRPIPSEMLLYARSDTHFLLHIYDRLREQLLQRAEGSPDLVREVLRRSEETALRTYVHEAYDAENGTGANGWENMAKKWNKSLQGVHFAVFKAVHQWRDTVARQEDESTRYVMNNNALFKLVDARPEDGPQLAQVLHPMNALLRKRSKELLDVIARTVKEYKEPAVVVPKHPHTTQPNPFAIGTQSLPIDLTADTDAQRAHLWDLSNNEHSAKVAGSSALFGVNFVPTWRDYCKPTSALFGGASPAEARTLTKNKQYLEVAAQIHSTLVIAPVLPKFEAVDVEMDGAEPVPPPAASSSAKTEANNDFIPIPTVPEEIAFVPKGGRTTVDPNAGDDIVVVGLRQKKRKRTKAVSGDAAETAEDTTTQTARRKKSKAEPVNGGQAEDVKEFDYSSVPNLLDNDDPQATAAPETEGKKKKKDKAPAKKTGGIDYGNFPKPPRNRSEMKAGNMARTFR
ncbi:hypothetical protein EXIGLDRAFT_711949 [Exidia glandulosa HHB12029]|uniref:HRDC domain-containing protein n=1 Tax=Exidia glandulosa HHB12029 TaxID=1314781 RepID=A0A165EI80_EXIGL|nr:hypothetical protein EXIGLDRAFT_711949 [Exidia glandulosa HHB12029]